MLAILAVSFTCDAREFDITSYGAKADGQTDCSPAIDAAILDAAAVGGGTIVIPAADSHYVITDSIHLRASDLVISGAGATLFLKDGSATGRTAAKDLLHIIWIHGTPDQPVDNIRVEGLTIDANFWGQTGNLSSWQAGAKVAGIIRAIQVEHAANLKIEHIAIRRPFVGVTLGRGAHRCEINDVVVTQFHHDAFGVTPGYVSAGASHIVFRRCTAADSMNGANGGFPGTRVKSWEIEEGAQDVKLIECTVRNTSANGFYIRPHSRRGKYETKNIELIRCHVENAGDLAFNIQAATADQPVNNVRLVNCQAETGTLAMQMNPDDVIVEGGQFRQMVIGFYKDYDDAHHFRHDETVKHVFDHLPTKKISVTDVTVHGDVRINASRGHDGRTEYTPEISLSNLSIGGDLYLVGSGAPVSMVNVHVDGSRYTRTMEQYLRPLEESRKPIELSSCVLKKCAASPDIDGKLNDECWGSLRSSQLVHHFQKPARRKAGHTWVRLCYDDRALYVAFDCRESRMDKLRTQATGRDADLWFDDGIEVFFHRAGDAPDYFRQWMINAAGVIYDGDRTHGESWNSGMIAATSQLADGYVVEMAIPWQDLGGDLSSDKEMFANFIRNRATDGNRYIWSWQYDGSVVFGAVAKMGKVSVEN